MILIDFNGLMYQCIYRALSVLKLKVDPNTSTYNTNEFMPSAKSFILDTIFNIQKKEGSDCVICVDNTKKGNWRSSIYKKYKYERKENRDKSQINFNEVFKDIELFLKAIRDNGLYKVISVEHAEADDCILCLAKELSKCGKVLIVSSDKDMIQAQVNKNVTQYSPMTKKYVKPETKDSTLDEWLIEHVVLGDSADNIPRIFDETEFTKEFSQYINISVQEFKNLSDQEKDVKVAEFFRLYPLSDIWKKEKIGIKKVQKMIHEKTIGAFIDRYRDNYERNRKLILEEFIPQNIRTEVLKEYSIPKENQNRDGFINYLLDNDMSNMISSVPLMSNKVIDINDFF